MTLLPAAAEKTRPLASSSQALVVTSADWETDNGTLRLYERANVHARWHSVGQPIEVVTGKKGMGWGAGIVAVAEHGIRKPGDPIKHEGDNRAPAGIFRLGPSFGFAAQPLPGWRMPYLPITASTECVDDPHSKHYNELVDRASTAVDWDSSEKMIQSHGLYRWGLVIQHNAPPAAPGLGSCIFMHIWISSAVGTEGCTAMTEPQVESLLGWLNPDSHPVLIQLPLAQYHRLARRWRLPALPRAPAD